MSLHFYLYRAPAHACPMVQWTEMQAQPLGTACEVRDKLAALYPQIRWTQRDDGTWAGLGTHAAPYLDVILREDEPGTCFFVVMNKPAPSTLRRVLQALEMNRVCVPETGDEVDPYAYEDHDRHYARRVL